jgi:hypothetical protein
MFGVFGERFFGVRHSLMGVRLLFGTLPNTLICIGIGYLALFESLVRMLGVFGTFRGVGISFVPPGANLGRSG